MNNLVGLGEMKITSVEDGRNIDNFYLGNIQKRKLKIFLSEDHSEFITVSGGSINFDCEGRCFVLTITSSYFNKELYNAFVEQRKIYDIVETGQIVEWSEEKKGEVSVGIYERQYVGFQFSHISFTGAAITYMFIATF